MIETATDPLSIKRRQSSDDAETMPTPLKVLNSSAQSYIETKNYVFDCNTQIGKYIWR